MESALPAGGLVFQVPAMSYPEAGRLAKMPDYAHLACHSYSQSLRWSYGTNRNRRWAEWQDAVYRLPTAEMVRALRTAGFDGLYFDRRGFADPWPVLAELNALLGPPVAVSDSNEQLLFSLATVPLAGDRDQLLNRPCALFQAGFLPWVSIEPRRALHAAEVRLVNPDDSVRRVTLAMNWRRRGPTESKVRVTGLGTDWDGTPPPTEGPIRFDFDLPPGEHILRFDTTPAPPWPARFYVAWEATDVRLTVHDGGQR